MELMKHYGTVKRTGPGTVFVAIVNEAACSGCHAKNSCTIIDSKEKEIEIHTHGREYAPGEQVTVLFRETLGLKALWLGYLLPFIILLATLFIISSLTGNEVTGALIALGILFPYYFALWLNREKLKRTMTFEIEENI